MLLNLSRLLAAIAALAGLSPSMTWAEIQTITAEAAYIMGDGETPSFAENMALQKAKQMALEKAGTYLQSTTTVQNYRLTSDEIQTLAGGLIKVEVLEKQRTIVEGGGIRVSVKIRATVDPDQVQVLVDRIKGKSVVADYKKLQDDYFRLGREIEKWRELVAKAPSAQEREVALEQIQEQQKKLARLQQQEATLVQRIVSGEVLAAKAQEQLSKRQQEWAFLESLLQQILDHGHLLTIGEVQIETSLQSPELVTVGIPVTVQVNPAMREEILQLANTRGWETAQLALWDGIVVRPGTDPELLAAFQRALNSYGLRITAVLREGQRACVDVDRFLLRLAGNHEVIPLITVRYGYAPVAGVMTDSTRKKMPWFGISPAFGWSDEEARARAEDLRYINRQEQTPGFIAILNGTRRFIFKLKMPIDIAKTITAVHGEFQKGLNPPPPSLLSRGSGVEPCVIHHSDNRYPRD